MTVQQDNKNMTHKTPSERYQSEVGTPHPIGVTLDEDGVNFSLFANRATAVDLLLFETSTDPEPICSFSLDGATQKTLGFWHIYIRGAHAGLTYAYRVDGAHDLHRNGDRYNPQKILIDPYARGHIHELWKRSDACGPGDNLATSLRSMVINTTEYNWEDDQPLRVPMNETIIYEMHVRGFTRSPSSESRYPGTFFGIIEKIPYLQELGVTAVELLPIFDFDASEVKRMSPTGEPLRNYWGYDPISFFALQAKYCSSPRIDDHLNEFRDMVKALHKAGIEVILDVVFNHTTEGNHEGPTLNFKGLANAGYYMLSPQDRQYYMDFSGCGNTLNANYPITAKMILDALEYWVVDMHVDGFRFAEASVLARQENGQPVPSTPLIWQIELSDMLSHTKVIAEAWDAGGMNAVDSFPSYSWRVWNERYRDTIRRFVRGDRGMIDEVADVIVGSTDLFQSRGKLPVNSINYITSHDGFPLSDLVSYNGKHNEANGEGNADGMSDNLSWNCGLEGETDQPEIEALRLRQCKNFMTVLMLSEGVPMVVAGDEVRRTQHGNNNAYCQDNEMSWFDWTLAEKNQGFLRFCQQIIAFRKQHPLLQRNQFFTGQVNTRGLSDLSWHGCRLNAPGWNDPNSGVLSFTLGGTSEGSGSDGMDTDIHVMLNMEDQSLSFELPPLPDRAWYRAIDTALPSPHDIEETGEIGKMQEQVYQVQGHSAVVLISHR